VWPFSSRKRKLEQVRTSVPVTLVQSLPDKTHTWLEDKVERLTS